jgi:hypothetical protein
MASSDRSPAGRSGRQRPPSRSPAKSRAEDLAGSLSARMGELLLTDKEATGLVIGGIAAATVPKPRGRW